MDNQIETFIIHPQANRDETGKPKQELDAYRKEQLGICAREVFRKRLLAAGFVSYRGNHVNWYKVVNSEIILAVSVFTDFPYFQAPINLAFGAFSPIHPPKLPFKALYTSNDGLWDDGMEDATGSWMRNRLERGIRASYTSEPNSQIKRLCNPEGEPDELDSIVFPLFQEAERADNVIPYRLSFLKRDTLRKKGLPFIDECLFYKAEDQYPRCLELCNQTLDWFYQSKEQRVQAAVEHYQIRVNLANESYSNLLESIADGANADRERKKIEAHYKKMLDSVMQRYNEDLAYIDNWSLENLPKSQQQTFADFELRKAVLNGSRREEFEKSMNRRKKMFANKLEREMGLVL